MNTVEITLYGQGFHQVNLLIELGLSPKQIRNLKYEEDRVKKIMELQKKVKK